MYISYTHIRFKWNYSITPNMGRDNTSCRHHWLSNKKPSTRYRWLFLRSVGSCRLHPKALMDDAVCPGYSPELDGKPLLLKALPKS